MRTYAFFSLNDGAFSGAQYSGPDAMLAANTPEGCAAWPGAVDWLRQRVDLATMTLVACRPPAPPDTDLQTWAWDETVQEWVATPTLAGLFRRAEQLLQSALDAGAQAWGYDNVVSAASYVPSTSARFAAEAQALVAWRDAVWIWAGELQAAVLSGQSQYPDTEAELLAAMPQQPTRPEAP